MMTKNEKAHNRHGAGTDTSRADRYRRGMDVTDALLRRLQRIEELDRSAAPVAELLDELRALVEDAEAWVWCEGDDRAAAAIDRCRDALGAAVR